MKSKICVVDLEGTCWENKKLILPNGSHTKPVSEIIEIGAVLADIKTGQVLDIFDAFVKPVINPRLSDFCKTLTTISQDDVNEASFFHIVAANFKRWLKKYGGDDDILFASWGYYDKSQLLEDCATHEIEFPFDKEHLNLKEFFSTKMGFKNGKGVSKALKILKFEFEGTHHRGIDDAKNIHRIWLKIKDLPDKTDRKIIQDVPETSTPAC